MDRTDLIAEAGSKPRYVNSKLKKLKSWLVKKICFLNKSLNNENIKKSSSDIFTYVGNFLNVKKTRLIRNKT